MHLYIYPFLRELPRAGVLLMKGGGHTLVRVAAKPHVPKFLRFICLSFTSCIFVVVDSEKLLGRDINLEKV